MPAAIAVSVREEIIRRRQGQATFRQIAGALGVSYSATRRIWQQYVREGQLRPHYARCRPPAVRKLAELHQQAIALKRAHPGWGAGLIRLELAQHFAEEALPSDRTLQRWFRAAGVGRKRTDTSPRPHITRGRQAHQVWAMDAKEQIRLADGSYVSWLTITDEGSGAILSATLFPHPPLEPTGAAAGQASDTDDHAAVGATGNHADG